MHGFDSGKQRCFFTLRNRNLSELHERKCHARIQNFFQTGAGAPPDPGGSNQGVAAGVADHRKKHFLKNRMVFPLMNDSLAGIQIHTYSLRG